MSSNPDPAEQIYINGSDIAAELYDAISGNISDLIRYGEFQQIALSKNSKLGGGKGISQKSISEMLILRTCHPTLKTLSELLAGINNSGLPEARIEHLIRPGGIKELINNKGREHGQYLMIAAEHLLRLRQFSEEETSDFLNKLERINPGMVLEVVNTLRDIDNNIKSSTDLLKLLQ